MFKVNSRTKMWIVPLKTANWVDFGVVKLGVNSEGVQSVKDYNAGRHVKNVHLTFKPDAEIKAALREIKFEKYVPVKKSVN